MTTTLEMLEARGVDVITQEDVGSAGGWHRGIEAAQDRGPIHLSWIAPGRTTHFPRWC